MRVYRGIGELYTPFRRLEGAALAVAGGRVVWVGPEAEAPSGEAVDLGGRSVVPGLVDPHTHLVYAGDRYGEFLRRARGEGYEAILAAGGGIHATVRATVQADEAELLEAAWARARLLLARGVTALEVKSGYGLLPEAELRLLRVIQALKARTPQRLQATLLAHALPPGWDRARYLEAFLDLLSQARGLAEAVDVFCDRGAFSPEEAEAILRAARALGYGVKLHAEQLARTGGALLAARLGALSADHLEAATREDLEALAQAQVVAVLLPGAALMLRKPLPQAPLLRASGVRVALGSDHNPGTSPLLNPWLTLALAVHLAGLTPEEALIAHTAHAALALGWPDRGHLEAGAWADFLVLEGPALGPIYRFGEVPPLEVYIGGERVWSS